MSVELLPTPTDEITGLPHLILPYDVEPELSWDDYHHHFFPRRSLEPVLEKGASRDPEDLPLDTLADLAVRMSRGQLLARGVHMEAHRKRGGPRLPKTLDEKFNTVVAACSGVVSRFALDVRLPADKALVYMDDDTFAKVADPKVLCTERAFYDRPANYRRRVFGSFLMRCSLEQDLTQAISPRVIDLFLDAVETNNEARKAELGNLILKEALEVRLAPIEPIHRELRRQGLVQPRRTDLRTATRKLLHNDARPRYWSVLAGKLLTAA